MTDLPERLRIKASMIELGERIAWGSDSALMREAADALEMAAPAVQGEPVSLRERLFRGWEGCSNHGCVVVEPRPGMARTNGSCQCVVNASRSQLYMLQGRIQSVLNAAPQQSPDVTQLVEALEGALSGRPLDTEFWDRCEQFIVAYRKGGES